MNSSTSYYLVLLITGTFSVGITTSFLVKILLTQYLEKPVLEKMKFTPQVNRIFLIPFSGLVIVFGVGYFWNFSYGFLILFFIFLILFLKKKWPGWKKNIILRGKQDKLNQLFPTTLGMAIQALKTGQTLPQVIEYLSRECPQPLKEEMIIVCAEMNLGSSAEQALTKMAQRFPDFQEFHQFLESYMISRQTGANLTHLLQVLLEGMDEKNRILRKMDAMTAQARLSGLLMGLLPFLLGVVFFFMDPGLITPLFTNKIGWAILLLASVLETIGFLWINQLLRLEI
jgi:Flp pilus assembly protein TadB